MISMNTVVSLKDADSKTLYGGKATNLSKLLNVGLPVPSGFVVGIQAFGNGKLTASALKDLEHLIDISKSYAVRSSAVNEDAEDTSWAGQFETFLKVKPDKVLDAIEKCHGSTKDRAKSYAKERGEKNKNFDIAVVVQEMLDPEYAGVLFTRNPITGANEFVIEYIHGLGEELVSGKADPERIVTNGTNYVPAPFDLSKLITLAKKAEQTFGSPQDIEFASQNGTVWLLQSRPITTGSSQHLFDIGEPAELFYWGPSRTEALYMSDWLLATNKIFVEQSTDFSWPKPPKSLTLFHGHQMVWLSNENEFHTYAGSAFTSYLKTRDAVKEYEAWKVLCEQVDEAAEKKSDIFPKLVGAWEKTIAAEFSLYGAEIVIGNMLSRLNEKQRQEVWQECTLPDDPGFLQRIDNEILGGKSTTELVLSYPWIQDGYFGVTNKAAEYFDKRRDEIAGKTPSKVGDAKRRGAVAEKLRLTKEEMTALDLARALAKFMDDRKQWMMRTRRYLANLKKNSGPEHGCLYDTGTVTELDEKKVANLWKRYVDYKTVQGDLRGIVASRSEEDIVEGEVTVVDSPNVAVRAESILVTPSTSPSYVPLMRNAKALITNHGGMMSHAAIVAREFGLPCIVGTKTATKQLRTGDRVIMNLASGTIQRIP